MKLEFREGVALVAGGSGGIGRAIVERLSSAGVPVALTYHRHAVDASSFPGEVHSHAWGSSKLDDARDLITRVEREQGAVRYLVVATGIGQEQAFHTLEEPTWERLIDVNFAAPVALARAVITSMMKAGFGRVVLLGSISGERGLKGHTVYAASKAALAGLTRSLAQEAGPFGVTVNCVAPGFIETAMLDAVPDAAKRAWRSRIPLGRLGRPDDVASMVAYLASDAGAYVTGQTLIVDGGLSL